MNKKEVLETIDLMEAHADAIRNLCMSVRKHFEPAAKTTRAKKSSTTAMVIAKRELNIKRRAKRNT